MISLQRSMHSSQMYTPGPAMSFLTCFCDLPQKEHFSRSPPSPIRATYVLPALIGRRPGPDLRTLRAVRLGSPRRSTGEAVRTRRYPLAGHSPTPKTGVSEVGRERKPRPTSDPVLLS